MSKYNIKVLEVAEECKKQITMALSRLDSLRSAATVVDPLNRSPIPSSDSSREQEKPTDAWLLSLTIKYYYYYCYEL